MGEGFKGFVPNERGAVTPDTTAELKDKRSPLERLVAQRWESLNESLELFKEKEAEDSLDPVSFLAETVEVWEEQHERSEHINIMSPFDRVNFLLGLLIEKSGGWSAQKRTTVRRALYGFAQQAVGAMTLQQQSILNRTILSNPKIIEEIGRPKENEQKLIEVWMKDTVGRGVK